MTGAPSLNLDPEEGLPLHLLRRKKVLRLTPYRHHHEAPGHLLLLRNLKGRQVGEWRGWGGEGKWKDEWRGWVEEGGWRGWVERVGRGGWVGHCHTYIWCTVVTHLTTRDIFSIVHIWKCNTSLCLEPEPHSMYMYLMMYLHLILS